MSDAKRPLKQKILHEMRECLVIALYLFVVFSLLSVHKSMILAQYHIDFAIHGVALINALALAKVILIAQDLHLADQIRNAPLIYPTLVSSSTSPTTATRPDPAGHRSSNTQWD